MRHSRIEYSGNGREGEYLEVHYDFQGIRIELVRDKVKAPIQILRLKDSEAVALIAGMSSARLRRTEAENATKELQLGLYSSEAASVEKV